MCDEAHRRPVNTPHGMTGEMHSLEISEFRAAQPTGSSGEGQKSFRTGGATIGREQERARELGSTMVGIENYCSKFHLGVLIGGLGMS